MLCGIHFGNRGFFVKSSFLKAKAQDFPYFVGENAHLQAFKRLFLNIWFFLL